MPVLEAVTASPAVELYAPNLATRLRQVLDRRRQGEGMMITDRSTGYRASLAAGGTFELQAFTSDGAQKRSVVRTLFASNL